LDKKCKNKAIGNLLKSKIFYDFNRPTKVRINENETFSKKYCYYLKWPIVPKIKEMQFRIINNVYLSA